MRTSSTYTCFKRITAIISQLCLASTCYSASFPLPPSGTDLIGRITTTKASIDDTLLDIAKRYNIGQTEIVISNPRVDRWIPGEDREILLPTRYILPNAQHQGIVLNIPEMRLYYFPENQETQERQIITYPISIGRMDWQTPLGETRIIAKTKNPVWRPPISIKKEHAEQGDPLPDIVAAGPDNPLGNYAMRLNIPGYLIHSTNKPLGIGMRVTHGCVRMYPDDIQQLFPDITVGTTVEIVNQPLKVGWLADTLYLEVHPMLEEEQTSTEDLRQQTDLLLMKSTDAMPVQLDAQRIEQALQEQNGMPMAIGHLAE